MCRMKPTKAASVSFHLRFFHRCKVFVHLKQLKVDVLMFPAEGKRLWVGCVVACSCLFRQYSQQLRVGAMTLFIWVLVSACAPGTFTFSQQYPSSDPLFKYKHFWWVDPKRVRLSGFGFVKLTERLITTSRYICILCLWNETVPVFFNWLTFCTHRDRPLVLWQFNLSEPTEFNLC